MKRGSAWLSHGVELLAQAEEGGQVPLFDVVVVGSGYGGAVAAARLSALAGPDGKALKVCVLERGLEYPPGSFPSRLSDLVGHQRVSGAAAMGRQSLPEGLMDWHVGGDVWALVANGLGGGSLINAGVCARAQDVVLDRAAWPEPWRGNRQRWRLLYDRAEQALGAQRWPSGRVPKQDAMAQLARDTGGRCVPVTVTILPPDEDPVSGSATQAPLQPCIECGDCFSGCNVGAKRTLSHSYLGQAYRQGAELYCGATVRQVVPLRGQVCADGARWEVRYMLTDPLLLQARVEPFRIRARHVVLAAGTFGSTEILMRSRNEDFQVSGRLGEGFSANGDILAAFYGMNRVTNASPDESQDLRDRKVGPTITSQIEWPADPGAARDVMQDLTVPGALGWVFREALTTMMVPQRWTRCDLRTHTDRDPDLYAVDESAIRCTLLTVNYADDGASGRLEPASGWGGALRDGSVVVRWPRPAQGEWFKEADARLSKRTPAGSFLLRNPLTQFMPKADYLGIGQTSSRLLTVHPLGGCKMAANADEGVVDPYGRVYDSGIDLADRGDPAAEQLRSRHLHRVAHALHEGLHVLDGAIVPTSLGINPLLTITALAEGAIDQWVMDYGWMPVTPEQRALPDLQLQPGVAAPPSATAVRFSERMTGRLLPWSALQAADTHFCLSMRVHFEPVADLQAFLRRPQKRVRLEAFFAVGREEPGAATLLSPRDTPVSSPQEIRLQGIVTWLGEEPSCVGQRILRSYRTWTALRRHADRAADEAAERAGRPRMRRPWRELLAAATHFGAVRQLAYEFEPLSGPWTLVAHEGLEPLTLPAGTVFFGVKRLGYLLTDPKDPESANPWHQLANMALQARTPDGQVRALGTLEFDPLAMLDRYDLPLSVVGQDDMVSGIRDLTSLALYFGRLMFGLHMLNFRRPDYPVETQGRRELMRLPPLRYPSRPDLAALCIDPLDVPQQLPSGELIHLRLTRLRRSVAAPAGLPVVLIHGFGSGGIQFTHPAIDMPLAPWLATEGHDVWVAELRTSIGLCTSARQWVMDEVAKEDVPRLIDEVCQRSGSAQVQVVAHCIGAAMFCMATLAGRLHRKGADGREDGASKVAAAVLMQVGPGVMLPRSSRARGYLALRMQQIFGLDKVSSVASQDPRDAESLMDRLLSTYLYPANQRAHYRLGKDHAKNVRRTNANRSAGIFGQLFQYENMSEPVLDAMEDLLGDCNLTTYAQTALYAFGGRLTDQRGDDAYVTDHRMQTFFGFPVLYLHGEENKTFSCRTFYQNTGLATRLGLPFRQELVKGYGHLDCVVGRDALSRVFRPIARHLADPRGQISGAAGPPTCRVRLPSIGPWIGDARYDPQEQRLHLRIGLRADDLGRSLVTIVAAVDHPAGELLSPPPAGWTPLRQEAILDMPLALPMLQRCLATSHTPGAVDVLVSPVHEAKPAEAPEFRIAVHAKLRDLEDDARRRGVNVPAVPGLRIDQDWLDRIVDTAPRDLGLVLGACRQRPLLVDRKMADRSMAHIVGELDAATGAHAPIDAVILAGDQVYGDSRVDAAHPGSSGGRFFDAHREAWTAPAQREVMRRRPVYMVTDDHEFRNDYNDEVARGRPLEFGFAREAWSTYQLAAGPDPMQPGSPDSAWRSLVLRGFGVFLADTRSRRSDVTTVNRAQARIMDAQQMQDLKDWLLQQQGDPAIGARPKIVVTASPIAPLLADARGALSPLHGDGWQRFPASLSELLEWIGTNEIDNVLFLSGDYHRYVRCRLRIQASGHRPVSATSIVAGGLYAPYPFANAMRSEWLEPGLGEELPLSSTASWGYVIEQDCGGDGYVRLTLNDQGEIRSDWIRMPNRLEDGEA